MTTLQGPAWETDNRPATSSGVEQTGATKKGKQCRNVHTHITYTQIDFSQLNKSISGLDAKEGLSQRKAH